MNIDKFNNYRLNKFREISKNLKKINILLKNNLQIGGDITKQEIDDKFHRLVDKMDEFTFKISENEQRYAQALLEIDNILK